MNMSYWGLVYILHHEHRPPVMSTAPRMRRESQAVSAGGSCRLEVPYTDLQL